MSDVLSISHCISSTHATYANCALPIAGDERRKFKFSKGKQNDVIRNINGKRWNGGKHVWKEIWQARLSCLDG